MPSSDTPPPVDPLDHQGLVGEIASQFLGRGLDFLDFFQEGQIGLLLACERFDPAKGYRFSTMATQYIRGYITHAIYRDGRMIHIPSEWHARIPRLRNGTLKPEDLTAKQREFLPFAQAACDVNSWDQSDDPVYPIDTRATGGAAKEEDGEIIRLFAAIERLPKRERRAIVNRFGLMGKPMIFDEIGAELGVTRQRAQQLVQLGLRRLRILMRQQKVA